MQYSFVVVREVIIYDRWVVLYDMCTYMEDRWVLL